MPIRKSTQQGSAGRKADDPLRQEKKRLIEEQEAVMQELARKRKVLEDAPRKLEALKKKQREPIQIRFQASSRTAPKSFGKPHDKFSHDVASPRRPRARKAERNLAKLQFILFVVILGFILFMVWRSIPPM